MKYNDDFIDSVTKKSKEIIDAISDILDCEDYPAIINHLALINVLASHTSTMIKECDDFRKDHYETQTIDEYIRLMKIL